MEITHSQNQPGAPEWLAKATELKRVTLERLAAIPESGRDTVSPSETWSAAAVVEHLILVEECVAGLWREELITIPNARVGVKSGLASRIVRFIFSKTGLRVPTVPELEPIGGIRINELEIRWAAARKRLVDALPKDNHAAWILHPAFGPLSASQMGGLVNAHLEHHLRHWPRNDDQNKTKG